MDFNLVILKFIFILFIVVSLYFWYKFIKDKTMNNIQKESIDVIKKKYIKLDNKDFAIGLTYFNNKCHANSYNNHLKHSYDYVAVYLIKDNDIIAHFINYDSIDKTYVDDTLGVYILQYKIYLVEEFNTMITIDDLCEQLTKYKDIFYTSRYSLLRKYFTNKHNWTY